MAYVTEDIFLVNKKKSALILLINCENLKKNILKYYKIKIFVLQYL